MTDNINKIVVGLSGGVDSSVAALLLKQQGYQLQGIFMKNWDEDDDEYCTAEQDLSDAAAIALQLDIPLSTRNFSSEYWDKVFEYFLDECRLGRTPNPDILCNKEIKFKTFLEHATDLGADHIATGHYARCEYIRGKYRLFKAEDSNKDQSYFLYQLNQFQLSKSLFPLGSINKTLVRSLAEQHGFVNFDKKDSTGICFIGERKFKEFLSQYLPAQPGEILTVEGKSIGKHDGLMYYTLGQRQGLGIGGYSKGDGQAWYVVKKNLSENTLIVAQGHDHPSLFSDTVIATQPHWIADPPAQLPFKCWAKTRYRQSDQACRIEQLDENTCTVRFDQPQRAVTPGQSMVFYFEDECLGGSIIDNSFNS